MHRPDHPAAPPAGAAASGGWRSALVYAGCLALITIGALLGLLGLIKVQGVIIPLDIQTREGCLADPSLVPPQASCPHQAEAILHYPDGHTQVIRGTPQQVHRRMDSAVEAVIAAERRRGVGYLLVAALLVGSGIGAIVWEVVQRRRARRVGQPGDAASSPAR